MNLVSKTVGKSSVSLSSILKAQCQNLYLVASTGKFALKDSNEDATSSSQVWQSDVNPSTSTERPVVAEKIQRFIDEDWPRIFNMKIPFLNLRQIFGHIPDYKLITLHVNSFHVISLK